jgi:hypothetical protein
MQSSKLLHAVKLTEAAGWQQNVQNDWILIQQTAVVATRPGVNIPTYYSQLHSARYLQTGRRCKRKTGRAKPKQLIA